MLVGIEQRGVSWVLLVAPPQFAALLPTVWVYAAMGRSANLPTPQRASRALGVTALALGLAAGCQTPSHTCDRNASCDLVPGGDCDAQHRRCVYPDAACGERGRFSKFADAHAGRCRAALELDDSTAIAHRIETEVVLDGDPAELKLGPPLLIDSEFGVRGRVWLRWNDESLFVAAEVEDPMLEATIVNEGTLWDDDSLEIMFDTAWDRAAGTLPRSDDFKFVVTALNATGVSWGGIRPAIAWDTPVRSAVAIDGTLNQRTDADAGYQLEFEIPWTDAFPKPEAGVAWGMNVQINDRHDGTRRSLRWLGGEVGFNQPVGAVVLAFADRAPPSELRASGTQPSALPPFERLDLTLGPAQQAAIEQLTTGGRGSSAIDVHRNSRAALRQGTERLGATQADLVTRATSDLYAEVVSLPG